MSSLNDQRRFAFAFAFCCGLAWLATGTPAFAQSKTAAAPVLLKAAQVRPTASKSAAVPAPPGAVVVGPTVAANAGQPNAAPPPESPRSQKLKQTMYDRRPSTILLNWSRPFDPAKKLLAEKQKAAAEQALVRAAAEAAAKAAAKANPQPAVKPDDKADAGKAAAPDPKSAPAGKSPDPPKTATKDAKTPDAGKAAPPDPKSAPSKDAKKDEKKSEEKKPDDAKPDPIDIEILDLQLKVALGDWEAVKKYLAGLPGNEGKIGYRQICAALRNPPNGPPIPLPPDTVAEPARPSPFAEQHLFLVDDVLGLAAAAPMKKEKEDVEALANFLQLSLNGGAVIDTVVERLKVEAAKPAGAAALDRRQIAKLLQQANMPIYLVEFLPSVEKAVADKDIEALNLLAVYSIALTEKDRKSEHLEKAWEITQAVLAVPEGPYEEREAALLRAVELAPKVREKLGKAWLDGSFTSQVERGRRILATIGGMTVRGFQLNPHDTATRQKILLLQKSAVEALLKAAPDKPEPWRATLTMLAKAWLREAEFSKDNDYSTSRGPRMNRDVYGNIFFFNDPMQNQMQYRGNPNQPQAIATGDVLEVRPTAAWLERIEPELRPKIDMVAAQLLLKVNEETEAFPHIERIAKLYPDRGKELVEEYLRVWTRNHDPNASRRYTNPYYYMYGFERRAEGIPLTRSKQERNLQELAEVVAKLKKLPTGEVSEDLVAQAFTTCHSSAEVYRLEAIQKVFGPLQQIKPKTLARLAQGMRDNLAGVWRLPAEQEKAKTNRKQKDIQAEVVRGYQTALQVLDDAIAKHPNEWSLTLAKAAILHDRANYERELQKSSSFTPARQAALALFQKAAAQYAVAAPKLKEEEITTEAYELWFYAGLGAVDVGQITEETQSDDKQPKLIADAIGGLPGELSEKHKSRFANLLFNRMSSLKPGAKHKYLDAGFKIVGDHKAAHEARKVADYYRDLVHEIKLETVIDGDADVGHTGAFGVFVNIRHTREIERESGGFGKYLQNQNSYGFSYNWGRPTADYRDRFQETATQALKDHFEVVSVTFQNEKVNSRALPEYGWRVTPYAYLLLKPRGPQVDRLPPLRLDLDFLDTSGYVVIPVQSAVTPLVAKSAKGKPRPVASLRLTQTLDERQASKGKLVLEVRASANGLVGELDDLLDLPDGGFKRAKVDDQGVSVTKFAEDADNIAVVSERIWTIGFEAPAGEGKPTTFAFGKPKVTVAESTLQRYDDADLIPAEAVVTLEREYGSKKTSPAVWIALAAAAIAIFGGLTAALTRQKPKATNVVDLPEHLSPFAAAGILRQVRDSAKLSESERQALDADAAELERQFFANGAAPAGVDLRQVAARWLAAGDSQGARPIK